MDLGGFVVKKRAFSHTYVSKLHTFLPFKCGFSVIFGHKNVFSGGKIGEIAYKLLYAS